MKLALVLAGAFLFASAASAQNFTTVTGVVTDPNGIPYAGGSMSATLTPGSPGGWTLAGQPYNGSIGPVTLDSTGKFIANFGSNAVILPSGTQWLITVNSNPGGIPPPLGTGAQTFSVTITISGASQNISATLDAAAPKLTNFASSGSGTITGCSTSGGVLYENGTANTATCGPNVTYNSVSVILDVQNGGVTAAQGTLSVRGNGSGVVGIAPTLMNLDATSCTNTTWNLTMTADDAPSGTYASFCVNAQGNFEIGSQNATHDATIDMNYNTVSGHEVLEFLGSGNAADIETTGGYFCGTAAIISCTITMNGGTSGNGTLSVDATATTLTSTLPVKIGPDGVHPGNVAWVGNTTAAAVAANTFNIMGPNAATFTAYALQFPTTGPTNATPILSCGTPSSSVSTCTYVANGGGTVTNIATTSPITGGPITSTGTIACATCVTSAAALTNNAVVIGGGSQASSTISADTTTTHALFATAGAPAFRAIAAGDLPASTLAFPVTGTGIVSGAVPCGTSTTTLTMGALLASGGVVLGGGTGACPTTNTQLTFSAPTLTVGLAGTSSGILALTGSTSGNATFTAPATAGTRTNPVISSNYFQIGVAGTTTGELLLSGGTSGTATIQAPATAGTATNPITISNTLQLPSGTVYQWNADTGLSRAAAGQIDIGNGTAGDSSGSVFVTNANIFQINDKLSGSTIFSSTAPTISSGFGSGASIVSNAGTASFTVNVGTGGAASSGVIGLPSANSGWACTVTPNGAPQAGAVTYSAPTSTTSVTLTNYTLTTGVALAWTASLVLQVSCWGR